MMDYCSFDGKFVDNTCWFLPETPEIIMVDREEHYRVVYEWLRSFPAKQRMFLSIMVLGYDFDSYCPAPEGDDG